MESHDNRQPAPELLSVRDAAHRYGCHSDTVRKLVRDNEIPSTRLGTNGPVRIPRRQADRRFGIEQEGER
jgi:excisionase family DNA binding protein